MLAELRALFGGSPVCATKEEYRAAIIEDNLLAKRTDATRRLTAQRLGELYALDAAVPLFGAMRFLWQIDVPGQPLLAGLCANARDPLLRMTAEPALSAARGEVMSTESLSEAVGAAAPGRFNPSTQHKIARNAASSWTQSGHLTGRTRKLRSQAVTTPASTAYALFLGYLTGTRGDLLFDTYWARLLDAPRAQLYALTFEASRRGWLDYRRIGDVVEVRFSGLIAEAGLEGVCGQD